jgi:hypothetical protein
MELVNRYVQAVQSYLPAAQQQELGREISAHLFDALDNQAQLQGRPLSSIEIEQLLQQWGHPRLVAMQYAPPKPLVSSELMPLYWQSLKYLLGALFVLHVLKSSLTLLEADYFKLLQFLLQLLFGFADDAMLAFVGVTLFFYAASFSPQWLRWCSGGHWQIKDLPPVSRPWQRIAGSDIITDIATSAFLLLLLWYPLWMSFDAMASLRITLSTELQLWRPWLSGLLLLSLLAAVGWAWRPYWTRFTLGLNVLLNLLLALSFAALSQQDALLAATTQPLPALLTLAELDRVVRIGCLMASLYLLYEMVRDLRRWLLLAAAD